jgi:hypothetical protein
MRTKEVEDLFKDVAEFIKEALPGIGAREEDIPYMVGDISRRMEARLGVYQLTRGDIGDLRPFFRAMLKNIGEMVRDYSFYYQYKKRINEIYLQNGDWLSAYLDGVDADGDGSEAFIDYLEEVTQTRVKDVAHLQELTGITELGKWDRKKGEYVAPATKQNAIDRLTLSLTGARSDKYERLIQDAIKDGAKYKDLLRITPKDYGLPDSWGGGLATDQYSAILWAISYEFKINNPMGLILFPDLRSIATEMEAPYSVIMDCHKLTNKGWG